MKIVKTSTEKISDTQSIVPFSTEEKFRYDRINKKKLQDHFEVAFCGHFSAGKSTILNHLLKAEVLPTSPIPTSANLIHIRQGDLSLTLHTHEKEKDLFFDGDIPWEKVRQWGMDGNRSSGMTIHAPLPFLGSAGSIVDTPGVDSTDDNHEAVTVEQLYTTDLIVYVMDYNHVQSETNIYFLKQLSSLQKPIFIIINQIDKHEESEISLEAFKQSIQQMLTQWNIDFIDLYFTSMKYMDHPANQFSTFEQHLKSLLYHSHTLTNSSHVLLEKGFYQSVKNRISEDGQEEVRQIHETLESAGYQASDLDKQESLYRQLAETKNYEGVIRETYQKEMNRLYKNVTLFPYTTTELVRNWLESVQPGFKQGLLFSKKKTKEEQERRLDLLLQELQDKIKSQLLFHVQQYFYAVDRKQLTNEDEFNQAVRNLNINMSGEWLYKQVKTGPFNRDYVYTYTKEVTNKIVKEIQTKANKALELQIDGLEETYAIQQKNIEEKLETLKELEPYERKINHINQTYEKLLHEMDKRIQDLSINESFYKELSHTINLDYPLEVSETFDQVEMPSESVIDRQEENDPDSYLMQFSEEESTTWMKQVKEILQYRADSPLLQNERRQLLERIQRNQDQTYVISLFGAFSAGKSSFANALLGADVMPVSPHPTTATVITVKQSETNYPHGTAVISIKSKESLTDEVKSISHSLDLELDLISLKDQWNPNKQTFVSNWQKTSANYLSVIQSSLKNSSMTFGETLTVSLDELQPYVAEEKNACLVEKVTLYYDCQLTNQGIVLVDTPGVNSIHARHTNVAFQQLKQSDAVFYLTYYNHAFSKADHYFLQQMGKVNESFGQDKLYFIINASDLSETKGELQGVKHHVREQLKRNGIDHPRLYDLSSREGLQEKQSGLERQSSFASFEKTFYERTILELKLLSFEILQHQVQQYTNKISDTVTFMNQDKEAQVEKQKRVKKLASDETNRVESLIMNQTVEEVLHELDQFSLYLRQRIKFVLNDYFPVAINVSVLTGDNKKELHNQLISAIQEWRGLGERFLKQELEAVAIRLENAMKQASKRWLSAEKLQITEQLPYLYVEEDVEHMELDVKISDVTFMIDGKSYFPFLKSKKDFFENGKIKELKEQLVSIGAEEASSFINHYDGLFQNAAKDSLAMMEARLKDRLLKGIEEESLRFDAILDKNEQDGMKKELSALKALE